MRRTATVRLFPPAFLLTAVLSLCLSAATSRANPNLPVVISNVQVDPNPFSPNKDGLNETTHLTFTLSEPAIVWVEVIYPGSELRVGGTLVYSGIGHTTITLDGVQTSCTTDTLINEVTGVDSIVGVAGVNGFTWNGKANKKLYENPTLTELIQLPDTTYYYRIVARDLDGTGGNFVRQVIGKVTIDSKPPVISGVNAIPNPFSPNGDGINDYVNISFSLDGLPQNAGVGNIGFYVFVDGAGNRTFTMNPNTTTPAFRVAADTLDVPYRPIALQFIKRSANTADYSFQVRGGRILDSGDTVSVLTAPIRILATDPVNKVYPDPTKFSFIDDVIQVNGATGTLENNLVEVRTTSGAAKVDILDSQNINIAPNLTLDPPFIGNGNYTVSFPASGNGIEDGMYTFVITANDESGNVTQTSGSVRAQSTPLAVKDLTVVPDTLSPADSNGVADVASISYSINWDASVTVQLFRDSTFFNSSNLVYTLASTSPQTAGTHNLSWNGKDGSGKYVSQGAERQYRVIVTAIDPMTFETSEARAPLFVDNLKPAEVALNTLPAMVNTAALTVSGRTEPGSSVEIFLDGAFADSVRANAATGVFSSTKVTLSKQGVSKITARAYDAVRNGPTLSDTLSVLFDNRAPLVTDTLIYVSGTAQRLAGYVLLSYGPSDTVELRLWDGSGRVSGLDLGRSAVQVTSPGGQDVEGKTIVRPPDRLRFVPNSVNTALGSYNLSVSAYDSLGNSAQYTVAFSVGQASSGPSVSASGLVNATAPPGYINFSQAQPWAFTVTVADNSGSGINPNASLLELYNVTSGQHLDGATAFTAPGTFTFTAANPVATDGSKDGRYELRVVAEDNDPSSGTLDTRLSFLYDSRPPDSLVFSYSSTRVALTLYDRAGGSGVSLLAPRASALTVTAAGGGAVMTTQPEYSNDGDSTLIATFSPALGAGIYSVAANMYDRAGNNRTRNLTFVVDGPGLRPTVTAPGAPFGQMVNAAAFTQPLTVSLTLTDNSGAGIDWSATTARLFGPDSTEVGGALNHQNNILAFQAGRLISTGGADDGRWRLSVHAADLLGATSGTDTTFSFLLDNIPPDTAGVQFAADSGALYIDLTDRPAVAGRECAGVNILTATAAVTGPEGAVAATVSHDGVSRLTLRFDAGKPTASGTYALTVTASDRAGNQATLTRTFTLNISGYVDVSPPDSSLVYGPWLRVRAIARGVGQTFTPGAAASLRVNYRGVPLAGTQSVTGDTLKFQFADTLAEDGSADGRYDMLADLDVAELAGQAVSRTLFTVDNRAPDTSQVQVNVASDGVRVTAAFTDWGDYPDVAGIDRAETKVVIEDPDGHEIKPRNQTWLSTGELEADFDALSKAGLHRLRLTVTDRAGWNTLRRKTLVNSFGLSAGQSVAYVEEVPARTSAHISFVSGQAGARISRAVLRIFNLRGDLVRRVDVSDRIDGSGSSVNAEWLLKNDRGDLVMNGVFIYAWEISYDNGRHEEIRKTLAVARR